MVWKAARAQITYQQVQRCGPNEGRLVIPGFPFPMALDLPPVFRCCDEGQRISLVASLQCWDSNHDAHLLISKHEGAKFHLTGLLEGIGSTFSLVNAQFRKQFPLPWLVLDEQSNGFSVSILKQLEGFEI